MGSKEGSQVCPVCGQRVEALVGRHKTLGVWVPSWSPGPCRNPACVRYADEAAEEPAEAPGEGPGDPAATS